MLETIYTISQTIMEASAAVIAVTMAALVVIAAVEWFMENR